MFRAWTAKLHADNHTSIINLLSTDLFECKQPSCPRPSPDVAFHAKSIDQTPSLRARTPFRSGPPGIAAQRSVRPSPCFQTYRGPATASCCAEPRGGDLQAQSGPACCLPNTGRGRPEAPKTRASTKARLLSLIGRVSHLARCEAARWRRRRALSRATEKCRWMAIEEKCRLLVAGEAPSRLGWSGWFGESGGGWVS